MASAGQASGGGEQSSATGASGGHFQHLLTEIKKDAGGFIDSLSSRLGRMNPLTHEIDPTTAIVWLFDNAAHQNVSVDSTWRAELIGAFFERKSGMEASKIVAEVAAAVSMEHDEAAKKTIAKRLEPLLNQILPAHTATVKISGAGGTKRIGPTGPSGISHDEIAIAAGSHKDGDTITTEVTAAAESMSAVTRLVTSEGWAVVSDIDDTIKRTLTNSPTGIVQTTFVDEPVPIDGMPEFYNKLSSSLSHAPFWYLSASPYNLYPFLRSFRDKHYPWGTLLLRDASWMNIAGFIASLSMNTKDYKVQNLKELHQYWPKRKFVCIGDSTQSDPEAYGEMYRAQPQWIKAIWIRKVEDVQEVKDILPGQSQEERNKPERFENAFKDVPSSIWHVFSDPKELYEKLDALV